MSLVWKETGAFEFVCAFGEEEGNVVAEDRPSVGHFDGASMGEDGLRNGLNGVEEEFFLFLGHGRERLNDPVTERERIILCEDDGCGLMIRIFLRGNFGFKSGILPGSDLRIRAQEGSFVVQLAIEQAFALDDGL